MSSGAAGTAPRGWPGGAFCPPHRRFAPPPVPPSSAPFYCPPAPVLTGLGWPASVAALRSRGVHAVQSGRVVVAVVCVSSNGQAPRTCAPHAVVLAAGPAGGELERYGVSQLLGARNCSRLTRGHAFRQALALASRVAASLAASSAFPPAPPAGSQLGLGV